MDVVNHTDTPQEQQHVALAGVANIVANIEKDPDNPVPDVRGRNLRYTVIVPWY